MNAVEIEEAVSELASQPFDPVEFPFQFLTAFGNRETTVKRLRKGESNGSDVAGGVLQRSNIHIVVATPGGVGTSLATLRASPKTASQKAKFILATDGDSVEAEDLLSGDALACSYGEFGQHFAFFLPLAGISTVKEIKNNPIDVKATGRLNRLYVELLKDNPDWATEARRRELNQFMARLIFCFFAEDTGIFREDSFTTTISQMSHAGHGSGDERWGNTHEVLQHLFLSMDTDTTHEGEPDPRFRDAAGIKSWARIFPYVNGGLFTEVTECPRFSRTARAYLLRVGELKWKHINPDIFGSMIQAVAEDDERGELGLHYTSVPNILKVLNPLFLDDLREQLDAAGDNGRKLRNLRRRLSSIRVFDPACGSGNFLVIAYKEMRAIEAEIVARLGGESNLRFDERRSVIPLANFFGVEIKGFAAEIARLALLIAEFQADCLYLSQQEARAMVLPLHRTGQIKVGNALRENWLEVCPPLAQTAAEHDLAGATGRLGLDDNWASVANVAETYICGNPPYGGSKWQTAGQKDDLRLACGHHIREWKSLDYVAGWFVKAVEYAEKQTSSSAFVSTNSISQGLMVPLLWPYVLRFREISFAHTSFKWANLATRNAGVTVAVIGLRARSHEPKLIYAPEDDGQVTRREVSNINPYLVPANDVIVAPATKPASQLALMLFGNMPRDGGNLCLTPEEIGLIRGQPGVASLVKKYIGSDEMINGGSRGCLWIADDDLPLARSNPFIAERLQRVAAMRLGSAAPSTQAFASRPYRFVQIAGVAKNMSIAVAKVSSESRPYLPADIFDSDTILSDLLFGMYDAPLWNLSVVVSRIHLVWVATVCGKLETRYRYSNTLGWNTFPIPKVTEQNKADLTRCAENILLARQAHFPATISDLYDPEAMPDDLRRAHEENDDVLERIYIGRRFRNDTERLEKLFELYTKMTRDQPKAKKGRKVA
jgi:hypothetical protein